MDAGLLATILLVAGLFLIALELMIPNFGILGILATICLVVSLWSACQAWWGEHPAWFWTYISLLVVGVPGVLIGTLHLLQTTSLGNHVILRSGSGEDSSQASGGGPSMQELIGIRGVAKSLMTPGGMVEVNGIRLHAETIGMVIDPDTAIEVVSVRGRRVVVRPVTENEGASEVASGDSGTTEKVVTAAASPAQEATDVSDGELPAVTPSDPAQASSAQPASTDESIDFDIPSDYTKPESV